MAAEQNFHLNLGVVKVDVTTRDMQAHPSFILDMRDAHAERSVCILGVRRTVKEDVYNEGLSSKRTVRMTEWRVLGHRVGGRGREVNPIVPARLRQVR